MLINLMTERGWIGVAPFGRLRTARCSCWPKHLSFKPHAGYNGMASQLPYYVPVEWRYLLVVCSWGWDGRGGSTGTDGDVVSRHYEASSTDRNVREKG